MSSGRINSSASIATATKVIRAFGGSWQALEQAAELGEDGVHRIRLPRVNGRADEARA